MTDKTNDIYTSFYLGYAGSAKLIYDPSGNYIPNNAITESSGVLFSLTNAVYTRQLQIPKVASFYVPYQNYGSNSEVINSNSNGDVKSEIRLGFGVYNYSGSINFELTDKILQKIWTPSFFERKGLFHLVLNDGMNKLKIANCAWSNVQISAQPHSPVEMSISFLSTNGRNQQSTSLCVEDIQNTSNNDTFQNQEDLVRYWETGVTELGRLESFNLGFSRNVTPVYHNNDLYNPTYLKVGRTEVLASLTCLDYYNDETFDFDNEETEGIKIYVDEKKYVKFKQNVFNSQTYNINGLSDIGTKIYDISSLNTEVTEKIFEIGEDSL